MSFIRKRVIETEDGVYQPPLLWVDVAGPAVVLGIVVQGVISGRVPPALALLYVAVLLVMATFRLLQYRKFGRLGPPSVAIAGNTLVFARAHDSRGALTIELADLEQLIVYGRTGRRTYRFLRHGGTYVETVPMWGASVEECVIRFLQRALPSKVTVKEPQTLFASIRGDGP